MAAIGKSRKPDSQATVKEKEQGLNQQNKETTRHVLVKFVRNCIN